MGLDKIKALFPRKFVPEEEVFSHIHRGDRIFIGTGCGEPQYLVQALANYVRGRPRAVFDAEIFDIWSLGVVPYTDQKLKRHFRHDSFFIGENTRDAVNRGDADYTPVFLSQVPDLFRRKLLPVDVALIQTSAPDAYGYMSLGISVDITKAAVQAASLVIAQVNANMPRVHGDTFIHVEGVDFIIPHDEALLENKQTVSDDIAHRIGSYAARIIQDGDTIQIGYGSIPNAILCNLGEKRHLGVHTELMSDNIVELMKAHVIDNQEKSLDRGKTVATFCMGKAETYAYLHDNPGIEFRSIDYTNNPLIIARQKNMVAINSALEIDLTGQATAESIGKTFYSGIGGHADFMRGAVLAPNGKTILAMQSTAKNGTVSRIVPFLGEGAGATLNRGDVHYVITEYGVAYVRGKNIRERAMELIAIAHPDFRPWLIEKAKEYNLIYRDQAFIPGKPGEYPQDLETYRTTKTGFEIFLRPMKISDEPLLKDFIHDFSDESLYRRFFSRRTDMPHEFLQKLVVINYSENMAILAVLKEEEKEEIVGVGRFFLNHSTNYAELAFAVRDDHQGRGIGRELLSYLTIIARKRGLLGFTASVLVENRPMLHLLRGLEDEGHLLDKSMEAGVFSYRITFKQG